ncbi:MAG: DUF6768 family protein [Hyphomonadaceae bacterium]
MTQNIDDAIRQALTEEDARALERFGADQPLFPQVFQTFQGHLAWLNGIGWLAGFAAFGAAVYCGFRFWEAQEVRDMLIWACAGGLAVSMLVMIKIWFWLELEKNAIVREVKRLELQVARLAAKGVV